MNRLERRQKGFRPMHSDKYAERPILKVLDVPENPEPGSTLWHLNHLCGVLEGCMEETTEYNYIKGLIEQRIMEHEQDQ